MRSSKIYHNAYFWLENPNNLQDKEYFLACLKKFLDVSIYANQAMITQQPKSKNTIVESGYTFSLMVTFDSKRQHELFKEEDAHKDFVNEVSSLWRKVDVFNTEEVWSNAVYYAQTA